MAERNTPIFVVGFGRSGTTLLQSILGAHPRIAAPPETHFFRRIAAHEKYWGELSDDDVLRRVVEATVGQHLLTRAGFDVDRIFNRARTGPRTYAGVLDAVMHDFADRAGKPRWSEKTPSHEVKTIWKHFPDAQVLHIVRDPREAVASSIVKLGAFKDARGAAFAFRAFTRTTLRHGPRRAPSHYLRVSYEDLVADPLAVMTGVFAFLGEEFDPVIVTDPERRAVAGASPRSSLANRVRRPIDAAVTESSIDRLSPGGRRVVDGVIGGYLPKLGYDPLPMRERLTSEPIRWALSPLVLTRRGYRQLRERLSTPKRRYERFVREEQERAERFEVRFRADRGR